MNRSQHKFIEISISYPWTQSWDEMTPAGKGRFCAHCRKTVIDFTKWSDAALYEFFSKNTGSICGRYLSTQIERPIYIPYQPNSRLYRATVALGLTLLVAHPLHLQAQNRPPMTTALSDTLKRPKQAGKQAGEIAGKIVAEKREPVINAAVQVFQNGVLKGGCISDFDGNYLIKPLEPGGYDVLVTYIGYDSAKAGQVSVAAAVRTNQNFQLQRQAGNALHPFVVLGGGQPIVRKVNYNKESINRCGKTKSGVLLPLTSPPQLGFKAISLNVPATKHEAPFDPPGKRTYTHEEISHGQ